jgi:Kef-type K+ transport system membrane component KefB
MSNADAAAQFTTQLCIILVACFAAGQLGKRIGQPPVVGEMVAGVCLGPSLLGLVAPGLQADLFPRDSPSMTILYTLSQLGLVLYMFVIGLEFDVDMLRKDAKAAATVSLAGLFAPLALGVGLAFVLMADTGRYFTAGVSTPQAALFLGAAIATTAFPMLARIISERGIAGTRSGTLALAAGASTDAVSWCLLAIVVAVFHDDPKVALLAIGGGAFYAVLLLAGGRRVLARLLPVRASASDGSAAISSSALLITMVLVLSAGWYTNAVGIHAIFGGFLLGVVMPRGPVVRQLINWIEPLVKNLLLPLFFVYSGLNTELGLLSSPTLWLVTLGVLAASVLGKGVACYLAARGNGMPKYEAMAVGSLMNARGLIELILLNIGLQAGLITPTLFAVLVLMAVVTTLVATPAFNFAARRGALEGSTRSAGRADAPSTAVQVPDPRPGPRPVPAPDVRS